MTTPVVRVGDNGTEVEVAFKTKDCAGAEVALDISANTVLQIVFRKPSGTLLTKAAAFSVNCGTGDGTDGKASVFLTAAELDEAGAWAYEGFVTLASGSWATVPAEFRAAARV